jgi:hypothetical protein
VWTSAALSAWLGAGLAATWSLVEARAVGAWLDEGTTADSSVAARVISEQQPVASRGPATWRDVTVEHIGRALDFDGLPPDLGVYTPFAAEAEELDENTAAELGLLRRRHTAWPPGKAFGCLQTDDPSRATSWGYS